MNSNTGLMGHPLPSPLDKIVAALNAAGISVHFSSYKLDFGIERQATLLVSVDLEGAARGKIELNLYDPVWPAPQWKLFNEGRPAYGLKCHVKFGDAGTRLHVCDGVFWYSATRGPCGAWVHGDVAVDVSAGDQWKEWKKEDSL